MRMKDSFRGRKRIVRGLAWMVLLAIAAAVSAGASVARADAPRSASAAKARTSGERSDVEIRRVLNEQVEAWNRGDMDGFLKGYSDSDATIYVGKHTARGFTAIAANYRQSYPTREKMGRLAFSELDVHQLDQDYAVVVGRFGLKRSTEAGGDAGGVFSLIFEKTAEGWKIVLDHTS